MVFHGYKKSLNVQRASYAAKCQLQAAACMSVNALQLSDWWSAECAALCPPKAIKYFKYYRISVEN